MVLNWFIKSDTVDGEAQDTRHKTEINILSWSSGMGNGGSLMWEVAPERKRSMCRISPLGNGWIAVSLDYVPQSDKGAAGTAVPMPWDIGERKQLAGSSGRRKRGLFNRAVGNARCDSLVSASALRGRAAWIVEIFSTGSTSLR
jgi:hypothetical protein